MFRIAKYLLMGLLVSTPVLADDHGWGGHHHHHHRHYYDYGPEYIYVPQPMVEYVPVQPRYYAPPPPVRYYGYDQRSTQGLLGGVVGSAMGYELGGGDPLATGIGAAAGAWFGNGM